MTVVTSDNIVSFGKNKAKQKKTTTFNESIVQQSSESRHPVCHQLYYIVHDFLFSLLFLHFCESSLLLSQFSAWLYITWVLFWSVYSSMSVSYLGSSSPLVFQCSLVAIPGTVSFLLPEKPLTPVRILAPTKKLLTYTAVPTAGTDVNSAATKDVIGMQDREFEK